MGVARSEEIRKNGKRGGESVEVFTGQNTIPHRSTAFANQYNSGVFFTNNLFLSAVTKRERERERDPCHQMLLIADGCWRLLGLQGEGRH